MPAGAQAPGGPEGPEATLVEAAGPVALQACVLCVCCGGTEE